MFKWFLVNTAKKDPMIKYISGYQINSFSSLICKKIIERDSRQAYT